jgi:diadenosine tetraphosphate (Ap4A) HIT family hydrolase
VLVIPIRCVQTLKDLENDEKEDLFMVLKKVHEVVLTVNKSSGVTTGIQTGESAGQTVKVREYMASVSERATEKV